MPVRGPEGAARLPAVHGGAAGPRVDALVARAHELRLPIETLDGGRSTIWPRRRASGRRRRAAALPAYTVEDLVREAAGRPLLVVLDGIEDPHNVGAILRSADAAGATA